MSLIRSIVRDIKDGFGSLYRHNNDATLTSYYLLNSQPDDSSTEGLHDQDLVFQPDSSVHLVIQNTCWANLPPKLLQDVVRRLEESESTWPDRKHVVACAGVCRSWRIACKKIVKGPEVNGKLTFPVSLKQPGPRDGSIQCFIKKDAAKLTYQLFLYLNPADVLVENGKYLLSAKKNRQRTSSEYIISMDADNISKSSSAYIGKLRSNFLGTKFTMYDSQPPYTGAHIGEISYELNLRGLLGTLQPRKMQCTMHSIPASALNAGGIVPGQPDEVSNARPLVLKNRLPRWDEKVQCWRLNFHGRAPISSVKNFQLIAAAPQPAAGAPTLSLQSQPPVNDNVILQFGKVGKGLFTMDYRYPLSAFQAFAICLSSFGYKVCDM